MERYIRPELLDKYEFYNFGHALEILSQAFPNEWEDLQECLNKLEITIDDLRKAGGNESPIPKNLMMYCILLDGEKFVSLGIY